MSSKNIILRLTLTNYGEILGLAYNAGWDGVQGDCMYPKEMARRGTVTVVIEPVLPVAGVGRCAQGGPSDAKGYNGPGALAGVDINKGRRPDPMDGMVNSHENQ